MTQSGGGGGAKNTFSVTLYNFQKSMGAETPQAPPPPRAQNANVNPSHIPNPNNLGII